jgi:hypothetical protein
MKAIPLSVEEAVEFVELYLPYFLEASGQADAVERIHEFFSGCGFDVRANKGRGRRKNGRQTTPTGFGARVTRFLKRIRVWRSRKHATVVT